MSEEDRLKLENELLLTKSKAQMINLYLDLQQKVEQLEKDNKRLKEWKEDLLSENIELENIRKEAIKYVQEKADYPISYYHCLNDLLNILNKGSEE